MTANRPWASLSVFLGALTALCLTACSAGIDIGQATGTGSGTGTGGGGDAGFLEVNPSSLDLGTAVVNTTVTQTVVVSNLNGAEIDGITEAVSGANAAWFAVSGVPTTLAAGGQATVSISFAPLAVATPAQATLTVSATGIAAVTLTLTGTSIGTALQLDPSILNFGYVAITTTVVACTTITNVANVAVNITGITDFANEGGAFQLASTDDATPPNPFSLPITIAPGGSAKVCFELTPPITQDYTGSVTLVTTDPSGTNPVIQLTGWGGGPQIACTPLSLGFGATAFGSTSTLQVTCTNTGSAIPSDGLTFGSLMSSASAFRAQLGTEVGDGGLAPGQSAIIDVSYQPSNAAGDTGTLQIDSNGGQGRPVSIALSGAGTVLEVQPSILDFGYVELETTVIACTTITNGEGVAVSITGTSAFADEGGAFALASTDNATPPNPISYPISIVPGGSAEVCFELTPPIAQDYSGQATLLTSDPSGNPVIQLTGWGDGPQISCSPRSLDFGAIEPLSPSTLPVTCTNTGTAIPDIGLIIGSLMSSSDNFRAQLVTETGDGGVAPGQTATIEVTFEAFGDPAEYTGTLQIDNNGGQGQPVSISLSGSGT